MPAESTQSPLPPDVDARRLFADMLANTTDGIITTDAQGRISTVSPSVTTLLGYPPEELQGRSVHCLYPDGRRSATAVMAALGQSGCIRERQQKIVRKDGSLLEVVLTAVVLRNDAGKVCGTMGVFRDVSEIRALTREVSQAERMAAVATLAGGIAHNFNNLLMSVQGYVSLMLMEVSEQHRHFDMLQKVEAQICAGARLTRKLMGFAREGAYEVRPARINTLVGDVVERFMVAHPHLEARLALDAEDPAVLADRAQVEEALQNLLANAADAMPGGGTITCRTAVFAHTDIRDRAYTLKPGRYVQLSVSDTGAGIAAEHLPFIFEPFYSTKDTSQGAGLGLASVFGVVKAHGGFIDAASTVGEGARFDILLPLPATPPDAAPPKQAAAVRGNETVLVVDDEDVVRDVAAKMLEALGYRTLAAATGAEALSAFDGGGADLVLLDLSLEDADGADVFRALRDRGITARVLIASGRSLDDDAQALLDAGADGFIQKPFGIKDLSLAVRRILDS